MFTGLTVAVVTPFRDDRFDPAAFRKHVDWMIAEGVQNIIPCGTTGESATFTHEEQHAVIAETVRIAAGRVKVIAGAGSNCTREAVSLAQAAQRAGADAVLTITPYYNKPTQDGLFAHFKAVREACDLPLVLYNVPGRTGVNLAPETTARVMALGNLAAVKESTGSCEQVQQMVELGIPVLCGDDHYTLPFIALGARGVISVVGNFAPRLMRAYTDACLAGDLPQARRLHAQVCALQKVAFCETNPIPAKAAVAALGFCREEYRLPIVPMQPANRAKLLAVMKAQGILGG